MGPNRFCESNQKQPLNFAVLIFCSVAVFSAAGQAQPLAPEDPAHYEVLVEHNVMVPMRDGGQLATDIYRPAAERQAGWRKNSLSFWNARPYDKAAVRRAGRSTS